MNTPPLSAAVRVLLEHVLAIQRGATYDSFVVLAVDPAETFEDGSL